MIRDNQDNLQNMDFDHEYKCWSSYDIVVRLEKIGAGPKHFQDMQVFLVCYLAPPSQTYRIYSNQILRRKVQDKTSDLRLRIKMKKFGDDWTCTHVILPIFTF